MFLDKMIRVVTKMTVLNYLVGFRKLKILVFFTLAVYLTKLVFNFLNFYTLKYNNVFKFVQFIQASFEFVETFF